MKWPFFPGISRLREFQMVRILGDYTAAEGVLPLGAIGTIVYRHRAGAAYEVEFAEPFATVITLKNDEIAAIDD